MVSSMMLYFDGLVLLSLGQVFSSFNFSGVLKAPESLLHLTLMDVHAVNYTLAQGLPENLQSLTLYVNDYGQNLNVDLDFCPPESLIRWETNRVIQCMRHLVNMTHLTYDLPSLDNLDERDEYFLDHITHNCTTS
jgi:hypothetical protein